MFFLKQLPIKYKLTAMVVPASLLLLIVSTISLIENKNVMDESQRIDALVKFTAAGSALVHELQKERGASAGFLGSNGKSMINTMINQRKQTDVKLKVWLEQYAEIQNTIANTKMFSDLEKAKFKLNSLSQTREKISKLSISVADTVNYFTLTNEYFIDSVLSVSHITNDSNIASSLFSFYSFISSKERAGIERAVLSGTFAADKFSPGMYQKLIELITEQKAYMKPFIDSASTEQVAFYDRAMNHPAIATVKQMRAVANRKANQGNFGIEAGNWFSAATNRINELKRVEDKLSNDLLVHTKNMYDSASTVFYTLLISLIIVLSGLTYLVLNLYKLLTNQISSIVNAMEQVSVHNTLTARCEQISEDELGSLAISFNNMLESFAAAMDEMGKASEQLAAASEQANQVLEANKDMLQSQHLNSDQVAAASEQMTHTVQEVAQNTNDAAIKSSEINTVAKQATKVVQTNTKNVEVLSNEVERIGNMIGKMHENSADITNVVEVIKSIAEQINLLALNAAIEAARAEDQGRGFAVVADEVRSLAIRTQDSTSEIDSIIHQFRGATDDAFNAIKLGTEQAGSVTKDTKSVENILAEIVGSVSGIGEMMEQIATATAEQSRTTDQINVSITEINQGTSDAAMSAEQLQAVGQEQAHLAIRMQELATAYKV